MIKQFEEFQKMKLKDACKTMEDMTYSFINPVTNEPTFVPAKHYEGILNRTVEQFLDEHVKMEMLNTVFKQLEWLEKEYGNDFIKALICMDMKIKPLDMTIVQKIALEETHAFIEEQKNQGKKVDFHILNEQIKEKYNEALNDKDLHASIIRGEPINLENEIEDDFDDLDV